MKPTHRATLHRLTRGITALVVVVALLVAAPAALIAWWGNPWPAGGWAEVQLLTDRTIVGAIVAVGWLAWLQMSACILIEAVAATRGKTPARIRFAPGVQQEFVRSLIFSIAALGLGAGTVTTAAVAAPSDASPAAVQLMTTSAPVDLPAHQAQVKDEARQGPTITLPTDRTAWRLAEAHLSDGRRWKEIRDLNQGIELADGTLFTQGTQTLPAGTTLRLPADAQNLATAPPGDDHAQAVRGREPGDTASDDGGSDEKVGVVRGDTLWDIAEEETGDPYNHKALFEATKGIRQPGGEYLTNPDLIKPGWTIIIPHELLPENQHPHEAETEAQQPPPTEPVDPQPTEPTEPPTAENAPPTEAGTAPTDESDHLDGRDDTGDDSTILGMPWVLTGLTGAGTLLAGGLLIGLRQRRSAQMRARRPGRTIRPPDPELAPVARTISAAGEIGQETIGFIDATLRRLAGAVHTTGTAMPPVAAVEVLPGASGSLTVHLSDAADLPAPWQGTPDQLHWQIPTTSALDELGPVSDETDPPYPLLATIGQADTGELWLLNCEELGCLSLTGSLTAGRNLVRHMVAQLAVNPWSQNARVDCIGVAREAAPLAERICYHDDNAAADLIADAIADAVTMVDRATEYDIDVATGRTGQADDDLWPSRLIVLEAPPQTDITGKIAGLDELIGLINGQVGRTGTSILVLGEHAVAGGTELRTTSTGRLVLEQAGLDLTAVSLTSEEAAGAGLIYAQSEILDDVEIPVDASIATGWESYANGTGALRDEHTMARHSPHNAGTTSLLEADDQTYLTRAPVLPKDLESLAPKVAADVGEQIQEADPGLDEDYATWFSADAECARLSLLGPVIARTYGRALPKRRAYFTELLAFLWFWRRNGATRDQIVDAFGTPPDRVRKDLSVLREWLGTNPRTAQPYLPPADASPAARASGVNVYQLQGDGLLVDWDLFKRLRVRAQARGGRDGRADLEKAMQLVSGRPCDRLREGGWTWLAAAERHDHYMTAAIADVALTLTTHYLAENDTTRAREVTEIALLAAPEEEATRLSRVQITSTDGCRDEAQRILRDEVCNRSDDGDAPTDLSDRTKTIIDNHRWLAG